MVSRALVVLLLRAVAVLAIGNAFVGLLSVDWSPKWFINFVVLVVFGVCAALLVGRQPQFAAIFALISSSYLRGPQDASSDTANVLVPLVLWLIAIEQPAPLKGWARSLGEVFAAGSLGLAAATFFKLSWPGPDDWKYAALLSTPALALLSFRLVRHGVFRVSRSWWLPIGFAPAAIYLVAAVIWGFEGRDWTARMINLWLIIGPIGVVVATRGVPQELARQPRLEKPPSTSDLERQEGTDLAQTQTPRLPPS